MGSEREVRSCVVEASHICVLTDPADGLDVIARHTLDALTAAHRRRASAEGRVPNAA